MAEPTSGVYEFQVRVDFLRHPTYIAGNGYSIKWKRGNKAENKGTFGMVTERAAETASGDYIFNQIFTFRSTMERRDANIDKGFQPKYLEFSVYEHFGPNLGKKAKLAEADFDVARALPPKRDVTPQLLLSKTAGALLFLAVGYRRADSATTGSVPMFGCMSRAAAPDEGSKRKPQQPGGANQTRSAGWWSCGPQAATGPERTRKVQFSNEEPEQWNRSVDAASGEALIKANEAAVPGISVLLCEENTTGAYGIKNRLAPNGVEYRETVEEADDTCYSYVQSKAAIPTAPPKDDLAVADKGHHLNDKPKRTHFDLGHPEEDGMSDNAIPTVESARSLTSIRSGGSDSSRMRVEKPKQLARPNLNRASSLSPGRANVAQGTGSLYIPSDADGDKTFYYHEIDVVVLQRGGPQGLDPADATAYVRKTLDMPDYFSSINDIINEPDCRSTCDVGEITIPRIWTLAWGRSSDFHTTFHAQMKDTKYSEGAWEMPEDYKKWFGSRFNTWQTKAASYGNVKIIENVYYATFKFDETSRSSLIVHASQHVSGHDEFRIEHVFKCSADGDQLECDIYSKVVATTVALPEAYKSKMISSAKAYQTTFQSKLVQRTQVHLLKRVYTPGLYKNKAASFRRKMSQSTMKRAKRRLGDLGASMGTLSNLSRKLSQSHIKVKNLESYLAESKRADDSDTQSEPDRRIADIAAWRRLSQNETLTSKNLVKASMESLLGALNKMKREQLLQEGFTQQQILCLIRLVAVYPQQLDEHGAVEHPEIFDLVLKVLSLISTVSLTTILTAPAAVKTILAAWTVSGRRLEAHAGLVALLKNKADYVSARRTERSETLYENFEISDKVLERCSCRMTDARGNNTRGMLFITPQWLCFLAGSSKLMFSTYDITRIESDKRWLGSSLQVHIENRSIDVTDTNNSNNWQQTTLRFRLFFNPEKAESALRSVVKGGGRGRVRYSVKCL
ncbi:hypothetical protein DIPPA_23362 [Diplonema papillatum]|nr:hypothetical protein DIPPA_23362 [Diplonema papillatum]